MSANIIERRTYDVASICIESVDDGWTLMDAEGPSHWPSYDYDVQTPAPHPASVAPPALIREFLPLMSPDMAAGVLELHKAWRVGAARAAPWIRRASSASVALSAQGMRGASHVATVGPPEARRLALGAWAGSQDMARWFLFSSLERQVAETLYDWLVDHAYIIDGQLERQPEVMTITRRENVRRTPGLQYLTMGQWQRYCRALRPFEGRITPWSLAATLRQA